MRPETVHKEMLSRRLLRIKVVKALYAHFKSESDSLIVSEKNLLFSIDKTYELYHQMLWLIVDVAQYAEKRIELGRQKKLPTPEELNPNTRFIDNPVIAMIRDNEELVDFLERKKLGWSNYPELIKHLYLALTESDFYTAYMNSETPSFKEDVDVIGKFYSQIVCDDTMTEEVLEEQSILWNDDTDFAGIMVLSTLDNLKNEHDHIELLPQYKNEDDLAYARELFRYTLVHFKEHLEYIGKYTSNWEVERIAFMDNVIMATAMSELIDFPSIPVKVTLDEFIEIAKYYSTPGSSTFINGVLDKIVETLTAENRIQKSGRGLLDK